ncbi:hypothetical protein OROMI_017310 [Orobanche minor]
MEPEQQPSTSKKVKAEKTAKKEAKAEKLRSRQHVTAAVAGVSIDGPDALAANYGDIPLKDLQSSSISGRVWTTVSSLTEEFKDRTVLIRGRAQAIRAVGKKMVFFTVREKGYTVQCVLALAPDIVSAEMVKYGSCISKESFVDIEGVVTVPPGAIKGTSQQVEIQVRKIHCVNRAAALLPINVEDAARSEVEIEKALLENREQLVRVNQDTRLNNRVLDLRTPANQAIYRLEHQVIKLFRKFLDKKGFIEIFTPKLIAGSSEGGAKVLNWTTRTNVHVLHSHPSFTSRWQFVVILDVFILWVPFLGLKTLLPIDTCVNSRVLILKWRLKNTIPRYVMDLVGELFVDMFDKLNERCKKELEAIGKQYPFTPLKYTNRPSCHFFDWVDPEVNEYYKGLIRRFRDNSNVAAVEAAQRKLAVAEEKLIRLNQEVGQLTVAKAIEKEKAAVSIAMLKKDIEALQYRGKVNWYIILGLVVVIFFLVLIK